MEGIKELFVPEKDYMTDKVEVIKSKFGIVESIEETINEFNKFMTRVLAGIPPRIEINLAAAEGGIDYGTTAYALDMAWYARYKPMVDTVLSSMMWAFFAWRVFKRLPNIINGVSSGVDDIERL